MELKIFNFEIIRYGSLVIIIICWERHTETQKSWVKWRSFWNVDFSQSKWLLEILACRALFHKKLKFLEANTLQRFYYN